METSIGPSEQRRAAACAMWALSTLITTVSIGLALGRVGGSNSPAFVAMVLSGLVLLLNATGIWFAASTCPRSWLDRLVLCGAHLIAPVLTSCAWSDGGWSVGLWTLTMVLGGVSGGVAWAVSTDVPASFVDACVPPHASPVVSASEELVDNGPSLPESPPSRLDADVRQRSIRRRLDDAESIELEWLAEFPPGEQQVTLHIPIAPPLNTTPVVECEPLDDSEVEVHVGAAYPYGLRLDCRRRGDASSAVQIPIGILVESAGQPAAAA